MRFIIAILIITSVLSCKEEKQQPIEQIVQHKLPFYTTADFTPHWMSDSDSFKNIHSIPSFSFIDQNGKTITDKTFDDKIYIADFFFTTCPGICKKLTTNLTTVQKEFANDNNVLILSHSVTPDADSVSRLKEYAKQYGVISNKWYLVTGNKDSIYNIARQSYFADEDMGFQKNANDFLHTENMLLIDKHKRIRGIYKGTSPLEIQDMIKDIKLLQQEK
jgi:protein SCO1/2